MPHLKTNASNQYMARGVGWDGAVTQPITQAHPRQRLSSLTTDPSFNDRSLARIINTWEPYPRNDFRMHGDSPSYQGPVTCYRAWCQWLAGEPDQQPQPIPFLIFPGPPSSPSPTAKPKLPKALPISSASCWASTPSKKRTNGWTPSKT